MASNFFCLFFSFLFSSLVFFYIIIHIFIFDVSNFTFCILHTFALLCFCLFWCSVDMVAIDPL